MSSFETEIGVAASKGDNPAILSALVDTGTAYSMLPASVLDGLGVKPSRQQAFRAADGSAVSYDVGHARFFIGTESAYCPVIFGPEGRYLLGRVALGIFGLTADPVNRRLLPVEVLNL